MSSSAGKVLILPKGEYNNATQYQMLDAVRYNGSLYIAKKTTIGHVPADGEYWMLSAIGVSDIHWGDITGSIANQSDLINVLDAKQNVLTFDSTPTASSNNPVTSTGIKTALDTKQNTLTFDTTPTSGSTNPVTSEGILTAVNATASNLATIESSTTASQAYSVGDYLVLNGQLYEVTADVASGETLVVGTNISSTTVGTELTALNAGLIKAVNIPFSSFEWSKAQNRYVLSNYHPTFNTVIGYLVYGTNGMVVFGAYYYAQNDTLSVDGWVPSTASKITSIFQFVCYELGY